MLLATVLLGASLASAADVPRAPERMSDRQFALQALNRLGYGPRPGEVEKVEKMGVPAWIDLQLHPERIADDALQARLKAFPSLSMTGEQLLDAYPNMQRRRMFGLLGGGKPKDVVAEAAAAKLLRADMSERQLEEVLTDFWFNHFNVSAAKNQDRWLFIPYERDVIRPRVFGKFRDLLGAVAHSPAMLVYLDNYQSTIDARYAPVGAQDDIAEMEGAMNKNGGKGRRKLGLNENYARELLELHTLGVDGGYVQKDVTELARILTGWTIERPNKRNADKVKDVVFTFKRRMHDPGGKVLLGDPYAWAGEAEGERALDRLARDPHTAHFLALKLCRRFVADAPPEALVDRVAKRFLDSGGDLRETYRAIFESPEFREKRFFRSKVKTPLEFVASALRATGAEIRDPEKAARFVDALGMPLYRCEPPTGWPDRAEAWVNAGALVARLKAAQNLFNRRPDAAVSAAPDAPLGGVDRRDGRALVARLTEAYLGGVVAERTRSALFKRLDDPEISGARLDDQRRTYRVDRLAALVLGAPDFERR
ncbi:MAG TPA: DUF1800 domain-containing protein [Elusimicrobiota bacterium]|nr:DUF1800 domain-containing protein [Elusimicrobiota bacterium]